MLKGHALFHITTSVRHHLADKTISNRKPIQIADDVLTGSIKVVIRNVRSVNSPCPCARLGLHH
jgi:hypothetical protein